MAVMLNCGEDDVMSLVDGELLKDCTKCVIQACTLGLCVGLNCVDGNGSILCTGNVLAVASWFTAELTFKDITDIVRGVDGEAVKELIPLPVCRVELLCLEDRQSGFGKQLKCEDSKVTMGCFDDGLFEECAKLIVGFASSVTLIGNGGDDSTSYLKNEVIKE